MTEHTVMMTMPAWKWNEYGFCIKGFIDNWPSDVNGIALVQNPEDIPIKDIPDNLKILDFDKFVGERLNGFQKRNQDRDMHNMGTTGNIAVQAYKFAHKALAQLYVLENPPTRYVWYTDADLYTHKPVTHELLDSLTSTEAYIGCTPRWWKPKGYTETGLMLWDTQSPHHKRWCELYAECYDNDKIFEFDAWHDCIAFDYATKTTLSLGANLVDFGYGVRSSHPLVSGPLGAYFDHMKGQRKFVGHSRERVRMHGK